MLEWIVWETRKLKWLVERWWEELTKAILVWWWKWQHLVLCLILALLRWSLVCWKPKGLRGLAGGINGAVSAVVGDDSSNWLRTRGFPVQISHLFPEFTGLGLFPAESSSYELKSDRGRLLCWLLEFLNDCRLWQERRSSMSSRVDLNARITRNCKRTGH